MSKAKTTPKALPTAKEPRQTREQALARAAVNSSVTGVAVIGAYQDNLMGKDLDASELLDSLRESCDRVKVGDLSDLEAMLVTQATALQTLFASLARRAANQDHLLRYQTFMGLALKAQAQSRATISALVDLKFPRQATFVKQANIAHGPQQVNNSSFQNSTRACAHARQTETVPNELLEGSQHGSTDMDTRAAAASARSNPKVATLAPIHRTKTPRR